MRRMLMPLASGLLVIGLAAPAWAEDARPADRDRHETRHEWRDHDRDDWRHFDRDDRHHFDRDDWWWRHNGRRGDGDDWWWQHHERGHHDRDDD